MQYVYDSGINWVSYYILEDDILTYSHRAHRGEAGHVETDLEIIFRGVPNATGGLTSKPRVVNTHAKLSDGRIVRLR